MARKNRIFIAHAVEDRPQIKNLYNDLKMLGFDPWLDEVDLLPGQIWKEEIPKAIIEAGVFLACLSARSVSKVSYVQYEFRRALSAFAERPPGSIYLIPVRLDECEIPDLQIPNLGRSLKDIQSVDLWEKDGLNRLILSIEIALAGYKPADPPLHPEVPSRWRHPTIVAAIIGACGTVAAAFLGSSFLEQFLPIGDKKKDEPVPFTPKPPIPLALHDPLSTKPVLLPSGETFRDCDVCPFWTTDRRKP